MDRDIALTNADARLLDLVWDAQPVASPELCRLAEEKLGWKRTTTYTVIRRLCEKGYLRSEDAVVSALVDREEAGRAEGMQVLARSFKGSLPAFLAAFLAGGSISDEDAEKIEALIAHYRRKG
ncbi:MAG: Penicillinase repressor [Firmicutes bacterium ADurb.Bin248]|nr:MAG: Penicillinase repressor [Firmicutes bacterium ADurb.Bin248]HOG01827.1 BlaI/MecI/CopY family transcriptional regulator [Clostridia bacterium]